MATGNAAFGRTISQRLPSWAGRLLPSMATPGAVGSRPHGRAGRKDHRADGCRWGRADAGLFPNILPPSTIIIGLRPLMTVPVGLIKSHLYYGLRNAIYIKNSVLRVLYFFVDKCCIFKLTNTLVADSVRFLPSVYIDCCKSYCNMRSTVFLPFSTIIWIILNQGLNNPRRKGNRLIFYQHPSIHSFILLLDAWKGTWKNLCHTVMILAFHQLSEKNYRPVALL